MTWSRGRAAIEQLLAEGELQEVQPSPELAERLMEDAGRHLASARAIAPADPNGAYQLAYDAARKACAALLAPQGLRATTRGRHVAVQDAVRNQFDDDGGLPAFRAFSRLRRARAAREYPDVGTPTTTSEDVDVGTPDSCRDRRRGPPAARDRAARPLRRDGRLSPAAARSSPSPSPFAVVGR